MLIAGYLKLLSKSNDNGVFAVCAQAAEINIHRRDAEGAEKTNYSPQRRKGRKEILLKKHFCVPCVFAVTNGS
jgi:hypothetical protein